MSILNQSFPNPAGGCCTSVSSRQFSASQHDISAEQDQQLLTGEDRQKKQEIDTLISEAFKTLSFQERQVQQEQLHGVADEIAEEASIIENSLLDLESHIQKKKAGSVYEMAERMNPEYVHARAFRIMFLRANRYDAKAAAKQMMTFLEFKQELFGTEKLTKEITIDDLDEDDIACMKSGAMQWAGRDSRNRPIFLNLPGLRNYKYIQNELRYRFFVMMEASKSPENQIRGVVFLMYAIGDMRDSRNGQGYRENSNLATAIPIYTAAFHFVSDDLKQYLLGSAVVPVSSCCFLFDMRRLLFCVCSKVFRFQIMTDNASQSTRSLSVPSWHPFGVSVSLVVLWNSGGVAPILTRNQLGNVRISPAMVPEAYLKQFCQNKESTGARTNSVLIRGAYHRTESE